MTTTINRPRKFKGPRREYVLVPDANGNLQNVMLDQDILDDWDDILTITVGTRTFSQRAATEQDVADEKAEKVGDLIAENWSRLDIMDYTTMSREEKLTEHKGKLNQIEKKFSLETVSSLAETV